MRRTNRPPAFALALVLLALAAYGCGATGSDPDGGGGSGGGGRTVVVGDVEPDTTPEPTEPSEPGRTTVGEVPARIETGQPVELRTCEVDPEDPEQVLVEAIVVNDTGRPKLPQGLPVTIRDGDGTVISDDGTELWSSITIGPGRKALHRDEIDVDAPADDVECELGEPDLRDDALTGGDEIDPADLELGGCSPIEVTVRNRSDRPVGVTVLVEAFDAAGNSAGTFDLGQYPTTYSDGREPDETEVALPAGTTGAYSLDPAERVAEYETPLDGPVTSCEVVGTSMVEDPRSGEVIVD